MSLRLFDAHCDTAYELWRRKESLCRNSCHIDLEKAKVFSQYAQVFAFCSLAGSRWELTKDDFQNCLAYFQKELSTQNRIQAFFSLEGPEIVDCDPEALAQLRQHGFVMTTLTWNADNVLAGWHQSEKGLTEQGKAFVRSAREQGIYIDVSHLSEKAFWDLAEVTEKPILASHSNCRSLWDHSRNLTDDQLRVIAQSGGVVGLNLYVPFLGERASFETMRRHLEHMLSLCGEQHVALGGDLDGCDELPEGFSDLSDYGSFHEYLSAKGYGERLLDGIFYSNLSRLF